MSDGAPAPAPEPSRPRRPTEDSDLALIRAALHQQGQLLAAMMHVVYRVEAAVDRLGVQVERIARHLDLDEALDDTAPLRPAPAANP